MTKFHQRKNLPFTVAIPIPSRDRHGRALSRKLRREWEARTIHFLTECFGGATLIQATGEVRMADGSISVEFGQRVVVTGCGSVRDYHHYRAQIEEFAVLLKDGLDQESVFVLATPWGESYLLE